MWKQASSAVLCFLVRSMRVRAGVCPQGFVLNIEGSESGQEVLDAVEETSCPTL